MADRDRDPLSILRLPEAAVEPDRAFAAQLRARLALRLERRRPTDTHADARRDTQGATMTELVPYIAVSRARAAIDWYADALGATTAGDPIVMPDGRIGHAELSFGSARLMLSDAHPEIGVTAPAAGAGAAVTLFLGVATPADVDTLIDRALRTGAELMRPAANYDHGRNGVIRDPFGHRWMIGAPPERAAASIRHGDLGYASLWVGDVQATAAFFGAVLGWRYDPDPDGPTGGTHVADHRLHHGLWHHEGPPTLFCSFAVDDLAAALERVRAAGGTAGEPEEAPYGASAMCADDQGSAFGLYEPPGGPAPAASSTTPPPNGTDEGDIAYVTMEVVDSARARTFYGSVLGWRFSPGNVDDGFQADGPAPMFGLRGGADHACTVPMYRVDDIDAAVAAVRARGGRATEPDRQPYGVNAECEWEGVRFYLGQL